MALHTELTTPRLALCPETRIAYRENLIEHQHFAYRLEGHGVREARRHAARVVLELEICKPFHFGESENLLHTVAYVCKRHSHHGSNQANIVDSVQLGMPTDTEF